MNIRMNINIAGTIARNIAHIGRSFSSPSGLIIQPLASLFVGSNPSGAFNVCKKTCNECVTVNEINQI